MKKALVILGCVVGLTSSSTTQAYDIFDDFFDNVADHFKTSIRTTPLVKDLVPSAARDIIEEGDTIIVRVALAGFKKEEVKAEVKNNMVIITAEKANKAEAKNEKSSYYKEISESVKRTISLPSAVDETKATASFEDGILTVKIPKKKAEQQDTRYITIK